MEMIMVKIKNVSEFVQQCNAIPKDGKNLYFRGEKRSYPYTTPNIYRNQQLIENSSMADYYNRMFNLLGKVNNFDSIQLMTEFVNFQHYEALTPFLDITTNPLIALYFACEIDKENPDATGRIQIYKPPISNEIFITDKRLTIKNSVNFIDRDLLNRFISCFTFLKDNIRRHSSQVVLFNEVLTASEFLNVFQEELSDKSVTTAIIEGYSEEDFIPLFKFVPKELDGGKKSVFGGKTVEEAKKDIVDFLETFTDDKHYLNNILKKHVLPEADGVFKLEYFQDYLVRELSKFLSKFFTDLNSKSRLDTLIESPALVYNTVSTVQFVKTPLINSRIQNQSGAFIYPVIPNSYESIVEIVSGSISEFRIENTIEIDAVDKENIQQELANLGITPYFIYPDIKRASETVLKQLEE